MRKLKYSLPVKLLAAILFVVCGAGCGLCVCIAIIAYDCGFYLVPKGYVTLYSALEWFRETEPAWPSTYQIKMMEEHDLVYSVIFNMRVSSIVLALLAALLFILVFVYLMCAAGRRAGVEGIHLGFYDRIPFDIVLAAQIFAAVMLAMAFEEPFMWGRPDDMVILSILVCLEAMAALLVLLAGLYTFAARVKAGGWWRNTVVYMVLRICFIWVRAAFRFTLRLLRAMRLEWRVGLTVIALMFFDIIKMLFMGNRDEEPAIVLFTIMWAAVFCVTVFSANQLRKLKMTAKKLAGGELDYKVDTDRMYFDYRVMGEDLNSIGEGMSAAVDQRMRSERLKTELITNVSHDIKTPLTSIINYVDLLQKEHSPEEEVQYLDVLKRQSEKLRRLTVDLVEASKASTGNLPTELVPTNSEELINQAVAEYAEKFERGRLEPVVTTPEKPITVLADGRHLWRVLDNLFNNAVKYAQPGTRVYIDARRMDGGAVITVKNISRDRLNMSSDELMERFVRGDTSRHTEGSGLGLSIARSLTELMGGSFGISIDGDLFKAEIWLKVV